MLVEMIEMLKYIYIYMLLKWYIDKEYEYFIKLFIEVLDTNVE